MTEYVTVVTTNPTDDAALTEALEAHRRRRPRDGRIRHWDPADWRLVWPAPVIPMRSYLVPAPWWERARAWGRP